MKRIKRYSGNSATLQPKDMPTAKGTIQLWVLSVNLSKKNKPAVMERKKQKQKKKKKTYPKAKIFSNTRGREVDFERG